MVVTAAAAIARLPVSNPQSLRSPVRAVIGCMLGANMTVDIGQRILQWGTPVLGLLVSAAAAAAVGWLILRRVGKLDPVTSYFGAMPGGLIEMTLIGDAKGGNPSAIALLHAIRVFSVVLIMPLLVVALAGLGEMPAAAPVAHSGPFFDAQSQMWFLGCALGGMVLGRLLRLPSPDMFGALILSSAAHFMGWSAFALPQEVLAGAQVILGIGVGMRFVGLTYRMFLKLGILAMTVVASQVALMSASAYAMAWLTGFDFLLLLLAYAPGGLTEMSLMAIALGRDVAFVACHQLMRILGVLVASPLISAWAHRPRVPPPSPPDDHPK